ncbi:hypothetical protein OG948_51610 (plasmid) [Embleya sp. NBC_00888]|uniref:hypothetical protein n=1 Tax=Embleya sp. NBC_00888 TaxID=2975960 RepID=UPI002F910CCB|nr:hypothetical protein OG948_51610 [Embleya sp. NBC_00888]
MAAPVDSPALDSPTLDTAPSDPNGRRAVRGSRRRRWWRRWPVWAPTAAAVSAGAYAVVEAAWAVTDSAVPWKAHSAYPGAVQLGLGALALVAGGAAWAGRRAVGARVRRITGGVLVGSIPVVGFGMAPLPAYVVTITAGAGVESATGLAHVLLSTVLTTALLLTALAHRRRSAGTCPRCGRTHAAADPDVSLVHPAPSTASRRTRRTAFLLTCGLLPWVIVKTVWTLGGDALGITGQRWKASNSGESRAARALAAAGIDATVLAAGLAVFLIAGLMYPWGQRFPRRIPFLAGRRVPRLLPLIPALPTAFGLALYGVFLSVYAPLAALGVVPAPDPDPALGGTRSGTLWLVAFGASAFGGLGFALLIAARSYATRTRPACASPSGQPEAPLPTA